MSHQKKIIKNLYDNNFFFFLCLTILFNLHLDYTLSSIYISKVNLVQ